MNKTIVLLVMILASAASHMASDLYAPSLPHLPELLNTTPEWVKLTLGLNVLAFGLIQLVYGPLSDRFGRRPLFLVAIVMFSISSLMCGFADNVYELLIWRILQGMSAGAGAVLVLAVITDVFSSHQRVRALAIYGGVLAIAPALAPTLGGYIHVNLGWQYNFYLLATLTGVIAIFALYYLSETSTQPRMVLKASNVLSNYKALLKDRAFVGYALLTSCALGSVFAFVTAGPFILISNFGVATEHFGFYQLVTVVFFMVGSGISVSLTKKISPRCLLGVGLGLFVLGAAILVFVSTSNMLSPLSLVFIVGIIYMGLGPVFAVAPSLAMNTKSAPSGAAAAMLGSLEMVGPTLAATAISVFHDGTAQPYAWTVAITAIVALAIFFIILRRQDFIEQPVPENITLAEYR